MANSVPPVVRTISPNLTTFSKPFSRFGVLPIGGRSTAIKLKDGNGVWVLASTPLDEPTKTKLQEMGEVKLVLSLYLLGIFRWISTFSSFRYLVAGDLVHHIFISDYKNEYPNAKLIGVEGVPEKNYKLKFDGGA